MKRYILLCILICGALLTVTACGTSYEKNTWFSEEKLESCLVSELPVPSKTYLNKNSQEIFVSFSDAEFTHYAEEIYGYLKSCGFALLGSRGEQHNTLAGVFTSYYFKPANELSDFEVDGHYYFVYSDCAEPENLDFYTLVLYNYQKTEMHYGSEEFVFNTVITLRKGGAAMLDSGYLLKYSPITYGDALIEFLHEDGAPNTAAVGERVVVRLHPVMDVDIVLYANGVKIEQTHADSDYWEYVFIMPDEKVIITHETVGDSKNPPSSDETESDAWEE